MRIVAIGTLLALSGCPDANPVAPAAQGPSIRIDSIRFDPESATLSVVASLVPGTLAGRDKPVYVGVTAVTPEGAEIDLMVNELFPGSLGHPVEFYAEVGAPVRDVLIGAWDTKVEPCSVDRSGCKQFGFVLDGPLASWPPGLYDQGVRQRIPPASYRLRLEGADARGPGKAAARALGPVLAPFGSSVDSHVGVIEPNPGTVQVRYADDHDLMLAHIVADAVQQSLGTAPEVVKSPLEGDDIAIAVGVR